MANRLGGRLAVYALTGALIMGLLLGAPQRARAANNCPWMNEATASGLLGATAAGKYTGTGPFQPGTCTFEAHADGGVRTLTIQVEIAQDAHAREMALLKECSASPIELRAIGNEAWICEAPADQVLGYGLVVGRVRNQVFSISFRSSLRDDPIQRGDLQQSRSYTAAEQVSGNLF